MPSSAQPRPTLLYFADAMCSWCYGFSPQMARVIESLPADYDLIVLSGGLRPFNTEPMTEEGKAKTRGHWERVAEASGQPFDFRFFDRQGFVYDSEPASRAVVTIRQMVPGLAFAFMAELSSSFYARNLDITDPNILAAHADALGIEPAEFLAAFHSPEMKEATMEDFRLAAKLGIDGFPTLVLAKGERLLLIGRGFMRAEDVIANLGQAEIA